MTSPLETRDPSTPQLLCDRAERIAPSCLRPFLRAIGALYDTDEFASALSAVRLAGDSAASRLPPLSDHLVWLSENGFSREDVRQIRYEVELWHSDAPAQAIVATLAVPEELCAAPSTHQCTLPLFGDRPAYRARIAEEMGGSIEDYQHAVRSVYDKVREVAGSMGSPPPEGIGPELIPELVAFLQASCEATVLACALRRMFIHAETQSRRATERTQS